MFVSATANSSDIESAPSISSSQVTNVDFRKECYIKIFGIPDCIKDRNYHKEYRISYNTEEGGLSHAMVTFKHQGAYHDFVNEFQNWRTDK